jgi:hypothetical protein
MNSFNGFLDELRGQIVTCAEASAREKRRAATSPRSRRRAWLLGALAALLLAGLALGVVLGRTSHPSAPAGRNQGTAAFVLPRSAGNRPSASAEQGAKARPFPGYFLRDVVGCAEDDVWAVGYLSVVDESTGNEAIHSLIVHWDGGAWRQARAPDWGDVYAITVDSEGGAWAVAGGGVTAQRGQRILRWDRHKWTAYPLPAGAGWIRDLVAVAPNDVWAVGERTGSMITRGKFSWNPEHVSIVHWDGTSWNTVAAPQGSRRGFLMSVSATSADDVWTVGRSDGADGRSLGNLVLHWDGRAWSSVHSVYRGDDAWLLTVAAIGRDDVWAGGGDLLQHWDGLAWRKVPHDFSTYSQLSALSASDIWLAAGRRGVVHWDGLRWRPLTFYGMGVASADRRMMAEAVAAVSERSVWVVGEVWPRRVSARYPQPAMPMILHWDGISWRVVVDSVQRSASE